MTFKINGTDYSDKVEVRGYIVTPRKIKGNAAGDLLNGESIADLIRTKTDLSVQVVAMVAEDVSSIAYACTGEYVELEFTDAITNTNLSGVYEPDISGIEMAIDEDYQGKRYYYGFSISFTEK